MTATPKVAIIDNSIEPDLYDPVSHWAPFLPVLWEAFRAPEGDLPNLEKGFTHIILTGSEASIVHREPWVMEEVALVQEAFKRGLAILGSCYGHQLLALALQGENCVRRCPQPEVGWIKVSATEKHPLFGGQENFSTFSLHFDEVVNLRPPCRVLARTEACPVQAFEVQGKPVWGIQFHPEIDIPTARHFLQKLVARGWPHRSLYEKALRSEPHDSGVISHIIGKFLGKT